MPQPQDPAIPKPSGYLAENALQREQREIREAREFANAITGVGGPPSTIAWQDLPIFSATIQVFHGIVDFFCHRYNYQQAVDAVENPHSPGSCF